MKLPVQKLTSSYHWKFSQNDFVKGIVKTTHKLTWQVQKKPFANRDLGMNDGRQKQRDGKHQKLIFTKMCVIACKVLESVYPACEENSVCKQAKKRVITLEKCMSWQLWYLYCHLLKMREGGTLSHLPSCSINLSTATVSLLSKICTPAMQTWDSIFTGSSIDHCQVISSPDAMTVFRVWFTIPMMLNDLKCCIKDFIR